MNMLPSCPADNIILESKGCVSKTNTSSACPFIQQSHIVKEGLKVISLKLNPMLSQYPRAFKNALMTVIYTLVYI